MHKTELIIGFCLLLTGAVPVGLQVLSGKMLPITSFGPAGLTGHDECCGSREITQFYYFWFLISFFLVGIGAWFFIAGLMSKPIVSKGAPKT